MKSSCKKKKKKLSASDIEFLLMSNLHMSNI
jgi:hypothetical protein